MFLGRMASLPFLQAVSDACKVDTCSEQNASDVHIQTLAGLLRDAAHGLG